MSLNRDLNPGLPKYKEGVLTTLLLGMVVLVEISGNNIKISKLYA
jgi:hypothetical protein